MAHPISFAIDLVGVAAILTAAQGCSTNSNQGAPDGSTMIPDGPSGTLVDASDASVCPNIPAVSYDRSCKVDSDCIAVGLGDSCFACEIGCANSAINKSAEGQYRSDVAKSPANGADCGCPTGPEVFSMGCCAGGSCSLDCRNAVPAVDAAADTGADAAAPDAGSNAAADGGPADAGSGE